MRENRRVGSSVIPLQKVIVLEGALDETEVSERFDLSPSKLRVAQRLRFAAAALGVRNDRRLVRAWTLKQIARVHIAHMLSVHLSIPFQAAIDTLLFGEKRGIYIVEPEGGPDVIDLCDASVILTDRLYLSFESSDGVIPLGHLETRDDGRTAFVADPSIEIPEIWTSRAEFVSGQARRAFMTIALPEHA